MVQVHLSARGSARPILVSLSIGGSAELTASVAPPQMARPPLGSFKGRLAYLWRGVGSVQGRIRWYPINPFSTSDITALTSVRESSTPVYDLQCQRITIPRRNPLRTCRARLFIVSHYIRQECRRLLRTSVIFYSCYVHTHDRSPASSQDSNHSHASHANAAMASNPTNQTQHRLNPLVFRCSCGFPLHSPFVITGQSISMTLSHLAFHTRRSLPFFLGPMFLCRLAHQINSPLMLPGTPPPVPGPAA